jgi:phosphonate transport system ATP-binding protein
MTQAQALVIQELSKAYVTGKPILKSINLTIDGRGITAIIGPSGTGKSTLVRCINRLVDPTHGQILFQGQDIAQLSGSALRHVRRKIGMVHQEYNLVERLSVMENVLSGRLGYMPAWKAWLRKYSDADIRTAFELLEAVGLGDFANRRADQLSGGQRQRVGIARALMQEPDLILADEPTSSLDPKTSVEVMEIMVKLTSARGIPVIINIHNVELAKRFANRIIGMALGQVVFDGVPEALKTHHLADIYGGESWMDAA